MKKIGIHSPEQTEKVFQQLTTRFPGLAFADTSWNNDWVDSFEITNVKIKSTDGDGNKFIENRYRIWMDDAEEGLQPAIEERMPSASAENKFHNFKSFDELYDYIGNTIVPLAKKKSILNKVDKLRNEVFKTA